MKFYNDDLKKLKRNDDGVTVLYAPHVTFYKMSDKNDDKTIKFDLTGDFEESEIDECFIKYRNGNYKTCGEFGYIDLTSGGRAFFYLAEDLDGMGYQVIPGSEYDSELLDFKTITGLDSKNASYEELVDAYKNIIGITKSL